MSGPRVGGGVLESSRSVSVGEGVGSEGPGDRSSVERKSGDCRVCDELGDCSRDEEASTGSAEGRVGVLSSGWVDAGDSANSVSLMLDRGSSTFSRSRALRLPVRGRTPLRGEGFGGGVVGGSLGMGLCGDALGVVEDPRTVNGSSNLGHWSEETLRLPLTRTCFLRRPASRLRVFPRSARQSGG